jgi:hypothetical protein
MWRGLTIAAGVLMLSALSGVGAYQLVRPAIERGHAGGYPGNMKWQEIAWTFPRDGWPSGRAFRCASCGQDVELYVRPKIGFCNCDTGVADDDEVDRVADLDLISARFAPTEAGKAIQLAGMAGRSRVYGLKMQDGAQHAAIGIALSHRCDLLVAVAQGDATPSELQREALEYLASGEMHRWMLASLGGR